MLIGNKRQAKESTAGLTIFCESIQDHDNEVGKKAVSAAK